MKRMLTLSVFFAGLALTLTGRVTGTANLLLAVRDAGVAKVVHTSSSAIFGIPESNPVREDSPCRPLEAYGRDLARFAGFAHLPMRSPAAAADELQRSVEQLGFRGALCVHVQRMRSGHVGAPPEDKFGSLPQGSPEITGKSRSLEPFACACCGHAFLRGRELPSLVSIGNERNRMPVAAKIALHRAGATGGSAGNASTPEAGAPADGGATRTRADGSWPGSTRPPARRTRRRPRLTVNDRRRRASCTTARRKRYR